jgi:hypothetical protein
MRIGPAEQPPGEDHPLIPNSHGPRGVREVELRDNIQEDTLIIGRANLNPGGVPVF